MVQVVGKAQDVYIQNSTINNFSGDQHNSRTDASLTCEVQTLAALKPAVRSGYNVFRCMEKTRECVFRKIDSWLDGTLGLSV
jgi:hypothetical protein